MRRNIPQIDLMCGDFDNHLENYLKEMISIEYNPQNQVELYYLREKLSKEIVITLQQKMVEVLNKLGDRSNDLKAIKFMENRIMEYAEDVKNLLTENAKLKEQLHNCTKDFGSISKSYASNRETFSPYFKESPLKLSKYDQEIKQFQNDFQMTQESLEKAQNLIMELEEQNIDLEKKNQILQKQISDLQDHVFQIESSFQKENQVLIMQQESLEQSQYKIIDLEKVVQNLEKKNQDLQNHIESSDNLAQSEKQNLIEEISNMKMKFQNEKNEYESNIKNLKQDLQNLRSDYQNAASFQKCKKYFCLIYIISDKNVIKIFLFNIYNQ